MRDQSFGETSTTCASLYQAVQIFPFHKPEVIMIEQKLAVLGIERDVSVIVETKVVFKFFMTCSETHTVKNLMETRTF